MTPLDKTISVIVPIYKVEAYLDRCVESIRNQTYRNLEIILVDDGSPDNCPTMCDEWAQKDERIKVIHKPNGGLSDARNAGMAVATGTLMGFVDGDDWIASTMYEKLYDSMQRSSCNMAVCGIRLVDENGEEIRAAAKGETKAAFLQGDQAMHSVIEEKEIGPTVWNKLYRSACIKDIPFAVGKTHEDVFWTYQAVHFCQSVTVIPDRLYDYVQRSNSIMNSGFSLKRLDAVEGKLIRLEFIQKNYPALAGKAKRDLLLFSLYIAQKAYSAKESRVLCQAHAYIKTVMKNNDITSVERSDYRRKDMVWLTSARYCLGLTCRIRNWLHIGI